jgi:hypothetical protein
MLHIVRLAVGNTESIHDMQRDMSTAKPGHRRQVDYWEDAYAARFGTRSKPGEPMATAGET